MAKRQKYSIVSLFSGAGGFDWGFHQTGHFKTVLACEKLPEPSETLAHNLGLIVKKMEGPTAAVVDIQPTVFQGDIQQLDFSSVNFQPDVLIGGPPCQDFSITISRKNESRPGLNGGRGKLYVEFARAVMFFQPKIFVFENVPGLLSANDGNAIKTIQNDLQHLEQLRDITIKAGQGDRVPLTPILNYKIIYNNIVDAPKIGVPQTRRRLIIIGIRQDVLSIFNPIEQAYIVDTLSRSLNGQDSLLARFPLTCIEIFEGQPLTQLQSQYEKVMSAYEDIIRDPRLPKAPDWHNRVWKNLTVGDIRHDYFLANGIEENPQNLADYADAMRDHESLLRDMGWLGKPIYKKKFRDHSNRRSRQSKEVASRMFMIPPDENYAFVDGTEWKVAGKEISFIYRRSSPLKPAWTVMAYGGGGTYGYHYERDRAQLTLRERARIQTFSDDFVFKAKKVRAQIGEAVPPLLGERIAENILLILNKIT